METQQDKILGSWFGMAVGDAMGMAVKGLKPQTVKQCFGPMDDFKDVRSFVGREIKYYRMKGLYGVQTQMALAVCDSLLKSRQAVLSDVADSLSELAAGGPEGYFGIFRGGEGISRQTVESFPDRLLLIPAEQNYASGGYLHLAVPIALYHQKNSPELMKQCMETCALFTRHPLEVIGAAVMGFLVTGCLSLEVEPEAKGLAENDAQQLLCQAVDACEMAESVFKDRFPEVWQEFGDRVGQALRKTLQGLQERVSSEEAALFNWICENASGYCKNSISHPTQGHVLTLVPLALYLVLKGGSDFQSVVTRTLNMGKEATKLGTLVGALAGALYGFEHIPKVWRSGLVNAKEIRTRGEALFLRRHNKGLKSLYDMESSLTAKESEERKRYLPKLTQKNQKKAAASIKVMKEDLEKSSLPRKEDPAEWRKFERDKSRSKRDRRRNLKSDFDL